MNIQQTTNLLIAAEAYNCSLGHTQTQAGKFHGKWKMRVCLKDDPLSV